VVQPIHRQDGPVRHLIEALEPGTTPNLRQACSEANLAKGADAVKRRMADGDGRMTEGLVRRTRPPGASAGTTSHFSINPGIRGIN